MLLMKIGENNEYKFYKPKGKGIDKFGISKALNPSDEIIVPTVFDEANITYKKNENTLYINPEKNHAILMVDGDKFGYPEEIIIGISYPTNCILPTVNYDEKRIELINYCEKKVPVFAFALNDFKKSINLENIIRTERLEKVFSDWRKKKTTVLTPVTSNGYTFKGEIDGHGKSIIIYSSPKSLGADKSFIEGFKKFLETNGLEMREEDNESIIYDPVYHNTYKAITPTLNLLQMLAKYGMVLFPSDNLP